MGKKLSFNTEPQQDFDKTNSYVLGVLRACEFLAKRFDEPTMAANIIRDELVVSGFCSLKYVKQLAKGEDLSLTKVWKESCLRGLS